MARHASPSRSTARRALIALATAGAALGAATATASAATAPSRPAPLGDVDPGAGLSALTTSLRYSVGALQDLKPNPLAGTGVDPLDNGVATQLADFRPLASHTLTAPIAQAESLGSVPMAGGLLGTLAD
ncbi:hypothetical protein AB0F77_01530 [Streptomyces sp. NPDC026672]|uniref:hypothetical protein n=1 Tax=unclassified Streptomyces TaxID=2593676 RepID=UPI0033C40CB7